MPDQGSINHQLYDNNHSQATRFRKASDQAQLSNHQEQLRKQTKDDQLKEQKKHQELRIQEYLVKINRAQ